MKICIWMNIPSHHQHFFFEALNALPDVELAVGYYDRGLLEQRVRNGWVAPELESYARFAEVDEISEPAMRDHIHIIPSLDLNGGKYLAEQAVRADLTWCHWGERTGVGFAKLVGFNQFLFKWLYPPLNKIRLRRHIGFIKRRAALALANGHLAEEELISWGVPKEKICFLSYSVPPLPSGPRSSVITNFSDGRIVFLCVASLCRLKGISYLLKAYAAMEDHKRKRCCLVFVGSEDASAYREFCKDKGIEDGVLFAGPCPSDAIAGAYNSSDCFVLPTLHDGWGVVLNEAASVGMPIISTEECGAAWHLVEPGVNGFRVPIKSSRRLKEAMEFYVDHPKKIAEHGEASKKLFDTVSPQNSAMRLVEYLKRVMRNPSQP